MNKFSTVAYPAIAILSVAAAFGAHAQTVDADRAGYGPSTDVWGPAITQPAQQTQAANVAAKDSTKQIVITAARPARTVEFDAADRAGYGPTLVPAVTGQTAVATRQPVRTAGVFDANDRAGYGPTPVTPSLRTRAEVRAEAIAALQAGYDAQYREGADPMYVVLTRPYNPFKKAAADTSHVMAAVPAKSAQ